MIKTLRITIVITAIVAVFFFVLSAAFGLRHDKEKEAFLAKPTATEIFKKNAPRRAAELESPLFKQAQAFALRINPPKPVERAMPVEIRKAVEAPKFRLMGTSYLPRDPNKSMALIDEPGKGLHWVSASEKIDYLTVLKIEDGKITYTDGKKTLEMIAEKPPETPGIIVLSGPDMEPASETPSEEQAVSEQTEPAVPEAQQETETATAEEVESNIEFIKQLMAEANEANENEQSISSEEVNELQGLGEFLKQVEEEQKKIEQQEEQNEANAVQTEPNE